MRCCCGCGGSRRCCCCGARAAERVLRLNLLVIRRGPVPAQLLHEPRFEQAPAAVTRRRPRSVGDLVGDVAAGAVGVVVAPSARARAAERGRQRVEYAAFLIHNERFRLEGHSQRASRVVEHEVPILGNAFDLSVTTRCCCRHRCGLEARKDERRRVRGNEVELDGAAHAQKRVCTGVGNAL